MDERDTGGGPSETQFDSYKVIRDEIKHEDDLIGQRVSWFTASQAFLLTALAIAHQGRAALPAVGNNYLFPLVPIVALASCVLILCGVLAGIAALWRWRAMLRALSTRDPQMPRLVDDRWIVALGWSAPIVLPVVFIVAWVYLLARGFSAAY